MKKLTIFLMFVFLLPLFAHGQTVLWSYKANGSLWEHIRSIKNIDDVNNDGHQDVIAVSENDTLYCLSGTDGTSIWKFTAGTCYLERGLIAVPDLDGDSTADVVLATIWGTRSVFAISGATGDTIWQYDTHEYGSGGWVYEVAPMSDMDGDSITDILASTGADPDRAYLFSGKTGAKIWENNLGYAVFGIREIGDLNGDSIPDVAIGTGDSSPSTYNIFTLDGLNGNQLWNKGLQGAGWTTITIGDLDGDNINDVIAGTMSGDITAFSGHNGSTIWTKNIGGTIVDLNTLSDINGNGADELLPSGTTINNFYCIDGLTSITLWSTPAPDQVFTSVRIPDITGDGKDDVACGTGYNTNVFFVLDGATGDTIWYKNMSGPVESCWWIEDIDGNGYPDILVGTRDGWIYALADGNVSIKEKNVNLTHNEKHPPIFITLYPNPLVRATEIHYTIPEDGNVKLTVYDVSGQKIKTITNTFMEKGEHTIHWYGTDFKNRIVPAGTYFCRIDINRKIVSTKMIILK
ncbi:MAG: hypothetical protein B5M53_02670 [Candidatus Cloacimonas sp. 4484_209]|nr:MAG: hypothetical protein B5M53_02670 [Candidatus Cloacimonas sp. 4484_209]